MRSKVALLFTILFYLFECEHQFGKPKSETKLIGIWQSRQTHNLSFAFMAKMANNIYIFFLIHVNSALP